MPRNSDRRTADWFTRNFGPAVPLEDYLADRREQGATWGAIAQEISELTDGLVTPDETTVARWSKRAGWEAQAKERTA